MKLNDSFLSPVMARVGRLITGSPPSEAEAALSFALKVTDAQGRAVACHSMRMQPAVETLDHSKGATAARSAQAQGQSDVTTGTVVCIDAKAQTATERPGHSGKTGDCGHVRIRFDNDPGQTGARADAHFDIEITTFGEASATAHKKGYAVGKAELILTDDTGAVLSAFALAPAPGSAPQMHGPHTQSLRIALPASKAYRSLYLRYSTLVVAGVR